MTMPPTLARVPGKRGAHESHEPRLLLSQFREARAAAPVEWDGSHGITAWGMDGNDQYGDCGPTATSNGNVAKADDTSLIDTLGTSTPLDLYFSYGVAMGEAPSVADKPDEGVENASWLGFLWKLGVIDGYGEVPLDELESYAQDFNGLLLAVVLDPDAEAQFAANPPIPWGQPGESPDPTMGHDVWLIQLHPDGSLGVITWAAIQAATPAFRRENITDAWAILDEDDAKRTGVNWGALQAALSAVHGIAAPDAPEPASVTPEPTPAPDPAPVAPEASRGIVADVEHGAEDIVHDVEHGTEDIVHDVEHDAEDAVLAAEAEAKRAADEAEEAAHAAREVEDQAVTDIEHILAEVAKAGGIPTHVLLSLVEARGATIVGWVRRHI